MTDQMVSPQSTGHDQAMLDYEVIVIGGGVAGIYQIKRLTDLGVNATVLEANSDSGWHLVQEPVSGRPIRLRELHLRLLVQQGVARRVALERTFLASA